MTTKSFCWISRDFRKIVTSYFEPVTLIGKSIISYTVPGEGVDEGGDTQETPVFSQLDRMPWAWFHTYLLVALAAVWASVGLEVALVPMFKEHIASSLGVSTANLSVTITLSLAGTAFGALVFGRRADLFSRYFAFRMSLTLCTLGAVLTSFCSGIEILSASRLIAGIGTGGCCVAMNTTVQELMPARWRGRACLAVNASFWLGPAVGALGAVWLFDGLGAVLDVDSWKAAFWINVVLLSLAMVLLRWVPESPRWLVTQGRFRAASKIIDEIKDSPPVIASPLITEPVSYDTSLDIRQGRPTLIKVGKIIFQEHWHRLLLCFAVMSAQAFFYNVSFFGHMDVLHQQLASDTDTGWHLLSIALGNFLGPILLGALVDDNNGRRRTMAVTFLASGVLLAATAVLFGLSKNGGPIDFGSVRFTVALTIIFFFASTAASTAYLTSIELFPIEIRALAFAIVFAGSMGVGGVLSPLLFDLAVGVGSRPAIAAVYLLAAMPMVAVAVVIAPEAWWSQWVSKLKRVSGPCEAAGRKVHSAPLGPIYRTTTVISARLVPRTRDIGGRQVFYPPKTLRMKAVRALAAAIMNGPSWPASTKRTPISI